MPARAASLRITEAYRTRMVGLRNRAKSAAKKTWAKTSVDNLDYTFNPGMLVLTVTQLQREAARLSAGYLTAYVSSEKGETVRPSIAVGMDIGKIWTGSNLNKAFRGAVIGTKIQIKEGKDPAQAYREGGKALQQTAGLAVDDVCRESLRVAMDQSPEVSGYVRAVKGTCEACLGAADGQTLAPGEHLDTHPNCQCVSEPVLNVHTDPVQNQQIAPGTPESIVTSAEDAANVIGYTHRFPEGTPRTVIKLQESGKTASTFGAPGGNPTISIADWHVGKDSLSSILHEYGHAVDLALGGRNYGSVISSDPLYGDLLKAIRESEAFGKLQTSWAKGNAAYYQNDRELFARAYAQWISEKQALPAIGGEADIAGGIQWASEDFGRIAEKFDRLFRKRGLLEE